MAENSCTIHIEEGVSKFLNWTVWGIFESWRGLLFRWRSFDSQKCTPQNRKLGFSKQKSFVLQILCLKVGKVIRAKIFTARARKDVCYGFVTMADPETAQKCVTELNKTKMPDGSIITVEKVLTRTDSDGYCNLHFKLHTSSLNLIVCQCMHFHPYYNSCKFSETLQISSICFYENHTPGMWDEFFSIFFGNPPKSSLANLVQKSTFWKSPKMLNLLTGGW